MKYFSLCYTPTADDFVSYAKKVEPAVFALRVKRLLIPFGLLAVAGLIFDFYFSVIALSFFVCAALIPAIINRDYIKLQKSSQFIMRPLCIDFYDNHIVQIFLPGGRFKGRNEKHFGFREVATVIESEEYIWFLTRSASVINIPKRILSEEQYGMLRNLTDNLFADKYQKI